MYVPIFLRGYLHRIHFQFRLKLNDEDALQLFYQELYRQGVFLDEDFDIGDPRDPGNRHVSMLMVHLRYRHVSMLIEVGSYFEYWVVKSSLVHFQGSSHLNKGSSQLFLIVHLMPHHLGNHQLM